MARDLDVGARNLDAMNFIDTIALACKKPRRGHVDHLELGDTQTQSACNCHECLLGFQWRTGANCGRFAIGEKTNGDSIDANMCTNKVSRHIIDAQRREAVSQALQIKPLAETGSSRDIDNDW